MLTYPWKCTVLHCNHLGNTWKPLVLMTRHFDYCPSASESSAPVVSRCFPGSYNVTLYISRGRLAWWLLAFLHSDTLVMVTYPAHLIVYHKITSSKGNAQTSAHEMIYTPMAVVIDNHHLKEPLLSTYGDSFPTV